VAVLAEGLHQRQFGENRRRKEARRGEPPSPIGCSRSSAWTAMSVAHGHAVGPRRERLMQRVSRLRNKVTTRIEGKYRYIRL
jgi:hypothetical protein